MAFRTWRPYVPSVARRKAGQRAAEAIAHGGSAVKPIAIAGRAIATRFWGKGWCSHLEAFSDFANRLPRGRTYVRNGSVVDLSIDKGVIEARVMGSRLYEVVVRIDPVQAPAWNVLKSRCAGQVGSLLELLQGQLSDRVMQHVTHRQTGLFPQPGEMTFDCSCPDWADMCKHVAAVLYGVGHRFDTDPGLLFRLRGVHASELIAESVTAPVAVPGSGRRRLADDQLTAIFGIDLAEDVAATSPSQAPPSKRSSSREKSRRPAESPIRNVEPSGHGIHKLRRSLGLSIAELADLLKVTPASISRWEASKGPLRLQRRCREALSALMSSIDAPGPARSRRSR